MTQERFPVEIIIEKGRIDTDEKSRIQDHISYVDSLKDLSDSDLTIEAILENLDIKKKVFSELESYVSEDCIIASNTSSLSIASIAASLKKPERCVGIHFFNPAPLMKLVEVIPAIQTSKDVLDASVKIITDCCSLRILDWKFDFHLLLEDGK